MGDNRLQAAEGLHIVFTDVHAICTSQTGRVRIRENSGKEDNEHEQDEDAENDGEQADRYRPLRLSGAAKA